MSADSLRGARVKLDRAKLHRRTAEREGRSFFHRHPDPGFRIEPDRDLGKVSIGEIFRIALVVTTGYPDPPDSFSARFGDALHNHRCALDHVAWQLVLRGATPPDVLSEWDRRRIQFPIYDTRNAFESHAAGRLPGVDRAIIGFIQSRHRYTGGNATNDALTSLASLSNDDKHRTPHLVTATFETMKNNVTAIRCTPLGYENPPTRPDVKDGAVVALATFQATGTNPEIQMDLTQP